jgi:hypothetical protein
MTQLIASLRIRRSRDVLRARQRARQIAGLLGYEGLEKSVISAKVFALALQVLEKTNGAKLLFRWIGDHLQVDCKYLPDSEGEPDSLPFRRGKSRRIKMSGQLSIDTGPSLLSGLSTEVDGLSLAFSPPEQPSQLERSDLPWVARELGRMTPLDPAEELRLLNQELLFLLRYAGVNWTSENRHENAA